MAQKPKKSAPKAKGTSRASKPRKSATKSKSPLKAGTKAKPGASSEAVPTEPDEIRGTHGYQPGYVEELGARSEEA